MPSFKKSAQMFYLKGRYEVIKAGNTPGRQYSAHRRCGWEEGETIWGPVFQ